MLTNDDKKNIRTILNNTIKSANPNDVIADCMKKLSTFTITEEHISYASNFLHYLKGTKIYQFNTRRKSNISYAHLFKEYEKYIKNIASDEEDYVLTNTDTSDSGDIDSNSDNFENVNSNLDYSVDFDNSILSLESNREAFKIFHRVDDDISSQVIGDDDMSSLVIQENLRKFIELRKIVSPPQKTDEWHSLRHKSITASDGGVVLNDNKYEQQYEFLVKKTRSRPFGSNKFCYHGTKYEEIATKIYEYRMDVKVDEFGLLQHPTIDFLAASPDGICSPYKLDGVRLSNKVGRMLEIKCPLVRKIIHSGIIKGNICPIYYWVQVQLQLECCDLEECDFWQCNLKEYSSKQEFLADTNPVETFKSISTGYEKGCVIQYMPDKVLEQSMYWESVYADSKFEYPPKINMSPDELDSWITEKLAKGCPFEGYKYDRVWYWKLVESNNTLIVRDKEWFAKSLPIFDKIWKYVLFLRQNSRALDIFNKIVESYKSCKKKNEAIMSAVDMLYNEDYESVESLIKNKPIVPIVQIKDNTIFTDSEDEPINTKTKTLPVIQKYDNIFTDSEDEPINTKTKTLPVIQKYDNIFTDSEDDNEQTKIEIKSITTKAISTKKADSMFTDSE